jgi:hypothetical protein
LTRKIAALQLVEPEITADNRVKIFRFAAMHAQHAHALGQFGIVRRAQTGIAERTEILTGKKREATDVADRADPHAFIFGADGLGSVLDDLQSMLLGDCHQRLHVGGLAVEVHRHQSADAPAGAAIDQLAAFDLAAARHELRDSLGGYVE